MTPSTFKCCAGAAFCLIFFLFYFIFCFCVQLLPCTRQAFDMNFMICIPPATLRWRGRSLAIMTLAPNMRYCACAITATTATAQFYNTNGAKKQMAGSNKLPATHSIIAHEHACEFSRCTSVCSTFRFQSRFAWHLLLLIEI